MTTTLEAELAYLRSLKIGEHVVETGRSCMWGISGVVYASENPEPGLCVMWDLGEQGKMGTSITQGTRRASDVVAEVERWNRADAFLRKNGVEVYHDDKQPAGVGDVVIVREDLRKVTDERDAARRASDAWASDMRAAALLCGMRDDEYPLQAVQRRVSELEKALGYIRRSLDEPSLDKPMSLKDHILTDNKPTCYATITELCDEIDALLQRAKSPTS